MAKNNTVENMIETARQGENPNLICRMKTGWLIMDHYQPVSGCCVLLADPVVPSLNALSENQRQDYLMDMACVGDALLELEGVTHINYETLGNLDPALHSHITPLYGKNSNSKDKHSTTSAFGRVFSRKFDPVKDADIQQTIRLGIQSRWRIML